jgi:hypothetical protein
MEVAEDPPVCGHLGLATKALGYVDRGLFVEVRLVGRDLSDGIGGFAAFAGPEPDDFS